MPIPCSYLNLHSGRALNVSGSLPGRGGMHGDTRAQPCPLPNALARFHLASTHLDGDASHSPDRVYNQPLEVRPAATQDSSTSAMRHFGHFLLVLLCAVLLALAAPGHQNPSSSRSVKPSPSQSPSASASVHPSASHSPSPSRSPSASASVHPSASHSPSPSRSPSASVSVHPSVSPSPSPSPSSVPGSLPPIVGGDTSKCPRGYHLAPNGAPSRPNGCSWVPDLWFRRCCNAHDTCYDTCGKSKWECDWRFLRCTRLRCSSIRWWNPLRWRCWLWAGRYSVGVGTLGQRAFDDAQRKHCVCVRDGGRT